MLTAIIIDDEVAAQRSLELLIKSYCPCLSLLAIGQSVSDGLELINKFNPDIVFLDIEMPGANGFELLEQLPEINFELIFITAYNQYAVKAFKYSAIDYILKPIDIDELVNAVEKVCELRKSRLSPRERYAALFQNIEEVLPRKLVIPTTEGYKYIDLSEVVILSTHKDKHTFTLVDGSTAEYPRGILDLEETLVSKGFIELKSDIMINLNRIERIDKKGSGSIIMTGNITVPLDQQNKDKLIEQLEKLSMKGKS